MKRLIEVEEFEEGQVVLVYGVDRSYHGVAVIMPDPDRKWDSFMRDADGNYRHFSYRIKFVDPVTENAKIWKQGMWTGNFIEADEAMTALVKGKSVHTLAGRKYS